MTSQPFTLDVTIDPVKICENNLCMEVLDVLKVIRPTWCAQENNVTKLNVKVFQEGACNHMYGYYQDGKFKEDVVLLRIYGHNSEMTIDRKVERETMEMMSNAGLCPPLYAVFNNGISYGFVNGVTLDETTVRDDKVKRLIAKEMLNMHRIKSKGRKPVTQLWDKMYSFLELTPESFENPEKHKQYLERIRPKDILRKEIDELKRHLEEIDSPVVLCHNDLLLNNIIFNEENGSVHFIDFEYAFYNYEHFELGNHFCEYAGLHELDFSQYPDREYQLEWLRYYIEEQSIENGGKRSDITEKIVEDCYVRTNKFALAAHMFWGICALVQAKHSSIVFDFLGYAQLKFDEYFARKEEFFALQLPV